MTVSRYYLVVQPLRGVRCALAGYMLLQKRLQGDIISAGGLPGGHASLPIPEQVTHCLQPSSAGINPFQSYRLA